MIRQPSQALQIQRRKPLPAPHFPCLRAQPRFLRPQGALPPPLDSWLSPFWHPNQRYGLNGSWFSGGSFRHLLWRIDRPPRSEGFLFEGVRNFLTEGSQKTPLLFQRLMAEPVGSLQIEERHPHHCHCRTTTRASRLSPPGQPCRSRRTLPTERPPLEAGCENRAIRRPHAHPSFKDADFPPWSLCFDLGVWKMQQDWLEPQMP